MDPIKFKEKTAPLLHYSSLKDKMTLKPQHRACEYCNLIVKNPTIHCEPYRLGTPLQYFKHKCVSCKAVVFDGSIKKQPHIMPNLTRVKKIAK